MRHRPAFIVLGWLAAAASAVAVGVVAVSLLGSSITGSSTAALSRQDVDAALQRPADPAGTPATTRPPTTTAPTAQPAPSTTRSGEPRGIGSAGGQLVASCRDGLAYLESWSPAQGFEVDDLDRGPDSEASVKFESERDEVEIEVTCRNGVPEGRVKQDD